MRSGKEKEEALKAGANDYLIKPMDIYRFTDHMAKWIGEANRRKHHNRAYLTLSVANVPLSDYDLRATLNT